MSEYAEQRGRRWRLQELGLLAFVVLCAIWTARHEFADILRVALRDAEQSHILMVPIIAAWLLYLRRGRLRTIRYRPSLSGVAILVAAWILVWLGHDRDIIVLQHVGALLLLLGSLVAMTGPVILRQFRCVLFVFLFLVPVPGIIRQSLAIPLQELAATITHSTLGFVGIEVVRTGSSLFVNGSQVAVGEACNGMRMVFAFTLLVYAFVFSVPLRPSTRNVLLVLSPAIALLCNVLRLVPTALVYGYGSAGRAEQFHDLAGWIMLPVAMIIMVTLLRLMNWLELPVRHWRLAQ